MSPTPLELCMDTRELSPDAIAALEARLATDAHDLEARLQLLAAYHHDGTPDGAARRHAHIFWLVEHHPELELEPFSSIDAEVEPAAYAEGKRRWLAVLAARPDDLEVLEHAVEYLVADDRDVAVELLRRAATLDPTTSRWRRDLAGLLLASDDGAGAVRELDAALALERDPVGRELVHEQLARALLLAGDHDRAEAVAQTLLSEASPRSWNHGNAQHRGHVTLGRLAAARGDLVEARARLAQAGAVPASPQLASFGPDLALATALLAAGERDAVLQYLTDCQRLCAAAAPKYERWRERIAAGELLTFE